MRAPPVRSYIHMALPMARASFLSTHAVRPKIGMRNGRRLDQVGGVAAQALALVERFVDEPDLALLEVAQAAVDQLGRLRRRARGEVVALDERGAQPTGGGVEGAPDAGDAAADHEHVERVSARRRRASGRSKAPVITRGA